MTSFRLNVAQILLLAVGGYVAACSSNDAANNARKKSSADDAEEEDGYGSSSNSKKKKKKSNVNIDTSSSVSEEDAAGSDTEGWCAKASETNVIKNKLGENFALFCDNGKPTELLTTTLLNSPYAGQGAPSFTDIKPLKSASGTTSYTFAVAIKIPIGLKTHFEKIGPLGGDVNEIKKVAEAGGAKATITMKDEFQNDGKYHARGWLFNQLAKVQVAIITVATEVDMRIDQYELTPGKHYLYTQYVDKSIQTMTNQDIITAGIEMNGSHMLLNVINVSTGNRNFPEIAEKEIRTTATNIIKHMYNLAADYDGAEVE